MNWTPYKLRQLKRRTSSGTSRVVATTTQTTESSMLLCRLYRDPTDADDTVAYDVAFLEFDLHYQIEKPGTDDEYPGA